MEENVKECILTIYCLAYNHEKYIRQTLEGFVNQKTKYQFRVIVHDDASTDGTVNIIKEYTEKYPDIIIPIYQQENQYSKNVSIFDNYIVPLLKGKYLAVCEGDDYWCDDYKIQTQIAYLEAHPDCSLCVHNTELIDENGKSLHKFFNNAQNDKNYNIKEVVEADGGGLFHTSAFMYRINDRLSKPEVFQIPKVGDYPLAIWLATLGYVHYIGKVMSVYRVGSVNSWVKKQLKSKSKSILHYQNVIDSMYKMSKFTEECYKESFQFIIDKYTMQIKLLQNDLIGILTNAQYRKQFMSLPPKKIIKAILTVNGFCKKNIL